MSYLKSYCEPRLLSRHPKKLLVNDNVGTSAVMSKIEREIVREMYHRKSDPQAKVSPSLIMYGKRQN